MSGDELAVALPDIEQRRALLRLHGLGQFRDLVDTDGDGLISFGEYVFFVTLLAVPRQDLREHFKRVDADGSGRVDRGEFLAMMHSVRGSVDYGRQIRDRDLLGRDLGRVRTGGDMARFFGSDGLGSLSLGDFEEYVQAVRRALLRHEFRMADGDGNGWLSGSEFARLLLPFAPADKVIEWGRRAQKRLVALHDAARTKDERSMQRVLFPEYEVLDEVVRKLPQLGAALEEAFAVQGQGQGDGGAEEGGEARGETGLDRGWFDVATRAVLNSDSE